MSTPTVGDTTSPLPPDLAADSAATWVDRDHVGSAPGEIDPEGLPTDPGSPPPAVLDPRLVPPVGATPRDRLDAWRARHGLRRARAEAFASRALSPQRGLPVADDAAVRGFLGTLLWRRRGWVVIVVVANAAAAVAGLLVPRLLGRLVDDTTRQVQTHATQQALDAATSAAVLVGGVVVLQALFTYAAKLSSAVMGQGILAEAREQIIRAILRLPLSRVEQASSGDLVTRVTRDVGTMSESVRWALPEAIISSVTVVLTLVAMGTNSWVLALPSYVLIAVSLVQIRRYLRSAPAGYLTESGSYSRINTALTETVEGARTVEALRLSSARRRRGIRDIEESAQAERYTMTLRNLLFIVMDIAFSLPRALTLALGAVGYQQGWASLGQITTALLYIEAIWGPFDMLVHTVDRVQVGMASTTRLLGIATVPPDREAGDDLPAGRDLVGRDLRYAYREGHDVLHGIDITLLTGERLAIVGPSGSGKSTLGRLLSGIHGPRTGSVRVGGVDLVRLPLDVLRTEVALVTQEHHVFMGSVRDNVVLAREGSTDAQVVDALRAVDAWDWVSALPEGLDARLGSGGATLTPGQAQQIALARLILADPHTLVLDEATSLIDPRTARHLEGSMNALLEGRTVVAIAHRLHTAHDADRIAVVIDGRVAELGSHDELLALDGEYASLWRAWTS